MKKKVFLKKLLHDDEWRYGIFFDYDRMINAVVKSIPGTAFSSSKGCWHVPCDESVLKALILAMKDIADVDISAISMPTERKKPDDEISRAFKHNKLSEVPFDISGAVDTKKYHRGISGKFGPVSFSVNDREERLIIRFMGRYDQAWISEMKTYGRLYYDKLRKEWSLVWSQMTVDSLADYFTSRGVEVKGTRQRLPEVIRERRQQTGSGVRENNLSDEAIKGIDKVRQYLDDNRYSIKTVEAYISMLELFFRYYHQRLPSGINESDISDFFHDFIFSNDYSASYQNQMVSAIKLYFNLNGNGRVNIMNLTRPRRSRSLPKVFSKEEVSRILNSPSNLKHKLMLMIIYSCGLRRSEVTNIRLRDLDRDRSVLNIIEGKGKVDRIVPVPPKIWIRLDEYIKSYRPVIYLFEGQTGGRYSSESVYRVFRDAMKRAGIDKEVGVHSLRHSYATHLHEKGLDIRYIQELLGHRSTRTTEIYTHVSRRNLMQVRSPIEDLDVS